MDGNEMLMGADVQSADGTKLGSIQRFIVHPDKNLVVGFLVGKGHMSSNRIVGVGHLKRCDAEQTVLGIDAAHFEELPVHVHEQMVKATGGYAYLGMNDPSVGGSKWTMRNPNSAGLSPLDSGSMYSIAPIGDVQAMNIDDLPEESVLLSNKTEVIGSDSHHIGHLHSMSFDGARKITGFVARSGHLLRHDVPVLADSVAGISHAHVRLNITSVQALDAAHAP